MIDTAKVPINVAVCGYGRIGKRHIDVIQRHPLMNLVAVVEIDQTLDIPYPNYRTIAEMLGNIKESVDVCTIATPNNFHAVQAVEVLSSGCHVLIEKPMALKKIDAESILMTALKMNKSAFVVMQNRFTPIAQWLKQIIENRTCGQIYHVQVNCFWNRDESYYKNNKWHGVKEMDGGALFTQFSHFIDLIYWLLGDIKICSANIKNLNHAYLGNFDDNGAIIFEARDENIIGSLNYSTSVAHKNLESSIVLITEKGSIKVGGQYLDQILFCDIENVASPTQTDYESGHYAVYSNIYDVLKGNHPIHTNALEGLKVVEMIENIYEQSLKKNC